MEYGVNGGWRPTSPWTAPPWKMLWLTVPPHGTEASSSLLRFEPQKSGGMLVLKNQQNHSVIVSNAPVFFCVFLLSLWTHETVIIDEQRLWYHVSYWPSGSTLQWERGDVWRACHNLLSIRCRLVSARVMKFTSIHTLCLWPRTFATSTDSRTSVNQAAGSTAST